MAQRTASRLRDRSLAFEQSLLQAMVDGSRDAIFLSDEQLRFVMVNQAASELTGYSCAELLRMRIPDLHEQQDLSAFLSYHRAILAGNEIVSQAKILRKNGEKVGVEFNNRSITIDGKLYMHTVARDITDRCRAEAALHALAEGTGSGKSDEFFRVCVKNLASAFAARYAFVGLISDAACQHIRTLAVWAGDDFLENFEYALAGTPCEDILAKRKEFISQDAASLYPDYPFLRENDIESYYGMPLVSTTDECIGLISVMHTEPLRPTSLTEHIPQTFANRIAAEVERVRAEEELMRTKRRIDDILRASPALIYKCGPPPQYTTVFVSENVKALTGYAPEDFYKGREFSNSRIHPSDLPHVNEQLSKIDAGKPLMLEYRFRTAGGDYIWLHDRLIPVLDKSQKVCGLVGSCLDITQRKQAETALLESEKRFRDLFDNAPDMYIILDSEGNVVDFNHRCLTRLGYDESTFRGKHLLEFVHGDDLEKMETFLTKLRNHGQPAQNFEIRLVSADGEIVWVSKKFSLSSNEDGRLLTIRLVCRDISERRRLQQDLSRAQRLETAGRVAGQVAHDLNNWLAPLTAYPALLRQEIPPSQPAFEMLQEMEVASERIADISQQLLSLGRRGHYAMEQIDVNRFVREIVASSHLADVIEVEWKLSSELKYIRGSRSQLARVFVNLLNNAAEAMPNGGTLTIETAGVSRTEAQASLAGPVKDDYVKVMISDTGSGIPDNALEKIFDPFFTTKRTARGSGSGLGLSVVHGIMQDHRGHVSAESQVGTGASFSLYFPVSPYAIRQDTVVHEDYLGGDETILIVDDDIIQRRVTDLLLRRLGYHTYTVSSGEDALVFLANGQCDLVVLDMMMTGIDGAETLRRLTELHPGQKTIIVSGYAASDRIRKAMELGAGAFIQKPMTMRELAVAVRKELDR